MEEGRRVNNRLEEWKCDKPLETREGIRKRGREE